VKQYCHFKQDEYTNYMINTTTIDSSIIQCSLIIMEFDAICLAASNLLFDPLTQFVGAKLYNFWPLYLPAMIIY
jgi:hypothetical protein